MAPPIADPEVLDKLKSLRNDGVETVPVGEIGEIVENILESLNGELSTIDQSLVGELENLSEFIRVSREDIAALRTDAVREEHIPTAKDELDAIVGATERATEEIMSASEKIQSVAESLDNDVADELTDQVMLIYEACSFQDITGQRITKVVSTLQKIEESVESILAAFGDEDARARVEAQTEEAIKPVEDADLMHGPQLEGSGNSQDEIDRLLASFD